MGFQTPIELKDQRINDEKRGGGGDETAAGSNRPPGDNPASTRVVVGMSLRGAFGFIRGQSLFDVTVVRGANCLAGGEINVVAALCRLRRLDAATARKAVNCQGLNRLD